MIDEIKEALTTKFTIAEYKKFIKNTKWVRLNDENIAKLYAYHKDFTKVLNQLVLLKPPKKGATSTAKYTAKNRIKKSLEQFEQFCKDNDIDIEVLENNQEKSEKTTQQAVDNSVDKNKKILDYLNIHTEKLKNELLSISKGKDPNDKSLITDYEECLHLFMAKAKGEIVTKSTKRLTNEEETIMGIIVDKEFMSGMYEITTQSHKPDEKALITTGIVLDIIETLKGKAGDVLTDEEMELEYIKSETKRLEDKEKAQLRSEAEEDIIDAVLEEVKPDGDD